MIKALPESEKVSWRACGTIRRGGRSRPCRGRHRRAVCAYRTPGPL